ncbi:MAG: hypothetical protein CME65_14620 [Halobacteriovoraceae bacterium]|nr:hypothetical protein [Halobacteriovoraceae bacterium]
MLFSIGSYSGFLRLIQRMRFFFQKSPENFNKGYLISIGENMEVLMDRDELIDYIEEMEEEIENLGRWLAIYSELYDREEVGELYRNLKMAFKQIKKAANY